MSRLGGLENQVTIFVTVKGPLAATGEPTKVDGSIAEAAEWVQMGFDLCAWVLSPEITHVLQLSRLQLSRLQLSGLQLSRCQNLPRRLDYVSHAQLAIHTRGTGMAVHRLGFIGAGQMARALASGLIKANRIAPEKISFADPVPAAVEGFLKAVPAAKPEACNADVITQSNAVILAVKPQNAQEVFQNLDPSKTKDTLFVSIVAGQTIASLQKGLNAERIVRVMPNTPCLIGSGASAYSRARGVSDEDAEMVGQWLSAVGIAVEVDEPLMDAVTGLSGSGPAFVYQVIESLSDGGVRAGLPRDLANQLAANTVLGAAQMVIETGEHPAVLKDSVASPGGTTIAGLQALEQGGLRGTLIEAVVAATRRSAELGRN